MKGSLRAFGLGNILSGLLLYVVFQRLFPNRLGWFQTLTLGLSIVLCATGVLQWIWPRGGVRAGLLIAWLMLGFSALTFSLLVLSASYIHAMYGQIGQVMAVLFSIAALMVVLLFAIFPYLQLKNLRTLRSGPQKS